MQASSPKIQEIKSSRFDPYQNKIVYTYNDPPEEWKKCLGDNLSFQFGLFDKAELTAGPKPGPVGPSEFQYFNRQLQLAGLFEPNRPSINRILDLGCGWGSITQLLATLFPECPCIDGVNISNRQLQYCAQNMPANLQNRISLYLCHGQDVDLLPNRSVLYDLIIARGVYTHFEHGIFENSVSRVVERLSPHGLLIISDTLYKSDLGRYESAIPDKQDRLACGYRKSPKYFVEVLERNGLRVQDMRIMPSNAEAIHWLEIVRLNIEHNFPGGAPDGPIQELQEMSVSFTQALAKDKASVYSIITTRAY